jgi:peptide-methionine (S)-S-oxide reductase
MPNTAALWLALAASLWQPICMAAAAPMKLAAPTIDDTKAPGAPQTAVLAAGCFWGVQGVFEHVRGVNKVIAGYAGSDAASAHYGIVGLGKSGHAESVRITFDPAVISFGEILQIAFSVVMDPTQADGQGPDIGSEYRSVVFYADDAQKRIAERYIRQLDRSHVLPRAIATRVDRLRGFYPAEDYHQDFLIHNPNYDYIATNDLPKIENLRRMFPTLYNEGPVVALGGDEHGNHDLP